MTTCIDITPAVHRHGGIGRYSEELVTALIALGKDALGDLWPITGFYNDSRRVHAPRPLPSIPAIASPLPHKVWRAQVMMAHVTQRNQANQFGPIDLFHGTDHLLPFLPNTPGVFTVHDMVFRIMPETQTRFNQLFLRMMMPRFLQHARRIIAVSENTARDIRRFYAVPAEKIATIHSAVHPRFRRIADQAVLDRVRAEYHLPRRFALFIGTVEPRKNLDNVLLAFEQAGVDDLHLVLGGRIGWKSTRVMRQLRSHAAAAQIHFPGYIADEDLPALYSLAEFFLLPSRYEGFGLPVLEAMACGAPVITSNVASLPEAAGDAAVLIDPTQPEMLAAAMAHLAANRARRDALQALGYRQAALFTWEKSARATVQVYRAAMGAVA